MRENHYYAHYHVRNNLLRYMKELGYLNNSSVLDVGCGKGDEVSPYYDGSVVGVDISREAVKEYSKNHIAVLSDACHLPFQDNSFEYVVATGLFHHLMRNGDLGQCLEECVRVSSKYVVVLEPNLFMVSGLVMNVGNIVIPGITGLDPHERAISPLTLLRLFKEKGLSEIKCIAGSYVWNRYPLFISKLIAKYEDKVRDVPPFSYLGWWNIVCGLKCA